MRKNPYLLYYCFNAETIYYFSGTAHCANMYPPAPTDLPQLEKARTTIKAYLSKWLTEINLNESNQSDNIQLDF